MLCDRDVMEFRHGIAAALGVALTSLIHSPESPCPNP